MNPSEITLVSPRLICGECRRPIWEDSDPLGNPYYRHMDARFDMVDFRDFHFATLYIPGEVNK
jgi:hypothetical protein